MKLHLRWPATGLLCLVVGSTAAAQQLESAEIQRLMDQAAQLQQGLPTPDMGNIQQLQQRALEMQDCLAGIDQSAMDRMRVDGEAIGSEIRTLCKGGERDAAQARALAYSQRIAAMPEVGELTHCGSMLTAMLPAAAAATAPRGAGGSAPSHVCDVELEP